MTRHAVVLMSPGTHSARPNATVQLLVAALPESVVVRDFGWWPAFTASYDVLHVHWPEALVRHRNPVVAALKKIAFALVIARAKVLRVGLVATLHNREPHEHGGRAERTILALWDRASTARVYMYPSALPRPRESRDHCIPRGDYEPSYGQYRTIGTQPVGRRLALVGQLRPYKGIENFVDEFVARPGSSRLDELDIAGEARSPEFRAALTRALDGRPGVSLAIGLMTDERLAARIRASRAVVLPYEEMYNSGVALLALTLGRPIIVTDSPTMRDLRDEAGDLWVYTIPASLTPDDWESMDDWLDLPRPERPELPGRDWSDVGRAYGELYANVAAGEETSGDPAPLR